MRSKYKNKKVEVDGIAFASKKEAARYQALHLLERGGVIENLELQKKFELIPKQTGGAKNERAVNYFADFVYYDIEKRKWVIEDTKGFRTPDYVIKRKLMKQLGYEITEL